MSDAIVIDRQTVIIVRLISTSAREWAAQWLDVPHLGEHSVILNRSDADAALEGMRDDGLYLTGDYNNA